MDLKGAAMAVLISILWGANTVVIKMGLEEAPPLRLAWMRFVVGGVVICLWAWATGRLAGFRVQPAEWRPLVLLGLLFSVQMTATNVGTWLTSAAHASVLLNLYAVHTVVLAHFLIPGDRLSLRKLVGVLVAYSGIVLLGARQIAHGSPTLLGDVIVTAAGALFVVVSALVEPAPTRWSWRLAASVGYQGVLISGFNFVVNLALLRRYRPSALSAFFLTQPIFGVIAAALVAGDPLTADLLIACAAVAVGIGLTSR